MQKNISDQKTLHEKSIFEIDCQNHFAVHGYLNCDLFLIVTSSGTKVLISETKLLLNSKLLGLFRTLCSYLLIDCSFRLFTVDSAVSPSG